MIEAVGTEEEVHPNAAGGGSCEAEKALLNRRYDELLGCPGVHVTDGEAPAVG